MSECIDRLTYLIIKTVLIRKRIEHEFIIYTNKHERVVSYSLHCDKYSFQDTNWLASQSALCIVTSVHLLREITLERSTIVRLRTQLRKTKNVSPFGILKI